MLRGAPGSRDQGQREGDFLVVTGGVVSCQPTTRYVWLVDEVFVTFPLDFFFNVLCRRVRAPGGV